MYQVLDQPRAAAKLLFADMSPSSHAALVRFAAMGGASTLEETIVPEKARYAALNATLR